MGRLAKGFLSETHPLVASLLLDESDGERYTYGTNIKVWWKCPECGHKMFKAISKVTSRGLKCELCSDGISIGEKIVHNILLNFNENVQKEKIFKWAKNKKYDFYIENLSLICEVFGSQHYQDEFNRIKTNSRKGRSYEEEHENDLIKEKLAKQNGIKNYIIIDAKESDLNYIKKSILDSDISKMFDLSELNWDSIYAKSLKSKVIEACELWNQGFKSTSEISSIIGRSASTVCKYLKKGTKANLCDYDPYLISCSQYVHGNEAVRKKVVCVNTKRVFNSATEAATFFKISNSHIGSCCKGKRSYSGIHPKSGECLVWVYYDDYDENKKYVIPKGKPTKKPKKIICIDNNQIFNSVNEAIKIVDITSTCAIRNNCNNITKYAGHLDNGKEAHWMYYDDYLKQLES